MVDLSTTKTELPPKNHNNPPSDIEMLGETLTLKHVHLMRAAESHAAIASQMPDHFTEESEAVYTVDFIKLMQNCIKELERRREEEKEPFLRQGQYVDGFFREYRTLVENAISKASNLLTDWLRRKADKEREEREADAKMLLERANATLQQANAGKETVENAVEAVQVATIAQSLAAAPIATLSSSTGKAARAGLTSKWSGTIKDIDKLDIIKLKPYIAVAELEKALARFIKQGGRQCEGCAIGEMMESKVK